MLKSLRDTKYVSNLQKGSMFPQKPHETIFRLYWQSNGRKAPTWVNHALGSLSTPSWAAAVLLRTTTSCPHVSWSCWARSIPRRWRWVTFELVTGWSLTHVQGLTRTDTHAHTLPVLRFVFGTFPLPVLALFFLFIFSHIDSFGKSAVWSVRGGSASLCVCLYSYTCLCEDQWDCFSLQSEDILSGSQIISDLQKALYSSDLIKRGRVWVTCRSRVEFSCDLKVFVEFHHIREERKKSQNHSCEAKTRYIMLCG